MISVPKKLGQLCCCLMLVWSASSIVTLLAGKRMGLSKGGNTNNLRALKVGLSMIWGLTFGWKSHHAKSTL